MRKMAHIKEQPNSWCDRRIQAGRRWCLILLSMIAALAANDCAAQFAPVQQDVVAMYLFNGTDEASFKRQLELRTELRVIRISEIAELDAEQVQKLHLAAHGDLSRFYREMRQIRERTKGLDLQNRNDMQRAWQEVQPLVERVNQGILGDNSLLERVLSQVLSPEQAERYRQYELQRQAARVHALLRMAIADLEKSLPLAETQRGELIKLAVGFQIPRKIDKGLETYIGFALLAKLSDEEIHQILDEEQRPIFRKLTQQYANLVHIIR